MPVKPAKRAALKKPQKKQGYRKKQRATIYREYSEQEKGSALACLDFYGGNLQRTANFLDIPRMTLVTWAKGRHVGAEAEKAHADQRSFLINQAAQTVVTLFGIMMIKAESAGYRDLARSVGILVDKLQVMMDLPSVISKIQTDDPVLLKSNYEKIVQGVLDEHAAAGKAITREQAISGILALKPEAKQYLM